jgi:hypothetical protein
MARGYGFTYGKTNTNTDKVKKQNLPEDVRLVRTGLQTPQANKSSETIASRNVPIKRNPSLTHPWAKNAGTAESGLVWIHINGKRILDQQSKGVGAITVPIGKPDVQFAFLAPLTITETNAHNWGEYDSLASRLAQKVRTAAKVGAEWTALTNTNIGGGLSLEDTAKNRTAAGRNQGQLISAWLHKLYGKTNSYSIPKLKVDTPLYYENSDRRSLNFEVMLISERDPKRDIIDPVHDLMKYAAPNLKPGGITIEFPYMFEVYTLPSSWIKYTTLALTAVQPTWNHPYIGQYPSSCNLQLTFKDMSPLYRGAIESGSVINVREAGVTGKKRAAGRQEPVILKIEKPSTKDSGSFDSIYGDEGGYVA